ncbi:MAG: transporter related, partial [Anaerocolumna sp.]|nr:transporter related [Anaerocolumna sp.]
MLKKVTKGIPLLIIAMFAASLATIIGALVSRKMMGILDFAFIKDIAAIQANTLPLIVLAFLLVPAGILSAITNYYYIRKTNQIVKGHYLERVFHKKISQFQKSSNSKYISALTNDFNTLETNLITGIYQVGVGIVNFIVGIWLISTVDKRIIVLAFLVIIINLILSVLTSEPVKKIYKDRSDLFDGYTSYIKEVLSAFHIVKNYNLQDRITKDYYDKSETIQQKGYIIDRFMTFIYAAQNFTALGSMYATFCIVGYYAFIGKVTPGGIILVTEGMQIMMAPVRELSETLPKLFTSKHLIQKLENTLSNEEVYEENISMQEFSDKIEFREVDFAYEEDDNLTLSNINLEFKKNGKYLIVGPSGGGKSTLLKLFRKYFNPTKGTILIDGKDLKYVHMEDYFKLITNIEQQVFIFEDTIKNNLTLYKEYSDDEIAVAIKGAGLTDFIDNLSDGLETTIYDNGKNISGGEKSRLVIARALLCKSSILFMDEAFASLDMSKAKEIEETILNLKDITVINVSHVIFK